jgi:hypothetical protein
MANMVLCHRATAAAVWLDREAKRPGGFETRLEFKELERIFLVGSQFMNYAQRI